MLPLRRQVSLCTCNFDPHFGSYSPELFRVAKSSDSSRRPPIHISVRKFADTTSRSHIANMAPDAFSRTTLASWTTFGTSASTDASCTWTSHPARATTSQTDLLPRICPTVRNNRRTTPVDHRDSESSRTSLMVMARKDKIEQPDDIGIRAPSQYRLTNSSSKTKRNEYEHNGARPKDHSTTIQFSMVTLLNNNTTSELIYFI